MQQHRLVTLRHEIHIHFSKFNVAMAIMPRMYAPSTFSRRLLVRRDLTPQMRLVVLPCRVVMPLSLTTCLFSHRQGAFDCVHCSHRVFALATCGAYVLIRLTGYLRRTHF